MYIQLLLNDHDPETELWSWGGEPIYRNGQYAGATTTTGYGFTFKQLVFFLCFWIENFFLIDNGKNAIFGIFFHQVCLGFVQNFDSSGQPQIVTNDYVLSGDYEVDICGTLYSAKVNLHSPNLPTKYPDVERDAYHATRAKMITEPILAQMWDSVFPYKQIFELLSRFRK